MKKTNENTPMKIWLAHYLCGGNDGFSFDRRTCIVVAENESDASALVYENNADTVDSFGRWTYSRIDCPKKASIIFSSNSRYGSLP